MRASRGRDEFSISKNVIVCLCMCHFALCNRSHGACIQQRPRVLSGTLAVVAFSFFESAAARTCSMYFQHGRTLIVTRDENIYVKNLDKRQIRLKVHKQTIRMPFNIAIITKLYALYFQPNLRHFLSS